MEVAALFGEAPLAHQPRGGRVCDIDDLDVVGAVVDGVDQVAIDPGVVHSTGHLVGEV